MRTLTVFLERVTAEARRVSFWGDGHVLELDSGVRVVNILLKTH